MKTRVAKPLLLPLMISASMALVGCGGASTTINEIDSIVVEDDHDHAESDGTASGRLLILNSADLESEVYDLSDGDLLASIVLDAVPSSVYATADYRYAALIERTEDKVSFIDGGLWEEPHEDHYDLFSATPSFSSYSLMGSTPTHFVAHDSLVALFLDGDEAAGENAGVQIFSEETIESEESPYEIAFDMAHHGVAEPRGEDLFTSVRRADADTTSANTLLPDQVAMYSLVDDAYEFQETLDVNCPDLHGAAQNESAIAFGCSDGVLLVTDNGDDTYTTQKLLNSDDVEDGLRIGSIWAHSESDQFIGQASAYGSDSVQFFTIDPVAVEMDLIDWEPMDGASPIARDFAFEAEQFVILDDLGYLTVIEPHVESDETHWEFGARLDITDADLSTIPDDSAFSMTFAQNGHTFYVADPIEQHVLTIDLELLEITGDIELSYIPSNITWLGVAE